MSISCWFSLTSLLQEQYPTGRGAESQANLKLYVWPWCLLMPISQQIFLYMTYTSFPTSVLDRNSLPIRRLRIFSLLIPLSHPLLSNKLNLMWRLWEGFFSSVHFSSVAQSCLTLCDHESQHARPPCPSPTHGVHSDSCPSSQWCHPAISNLPSPNHNLFLKRKFEP